MDNFNMDFYQNNEEPQKNNKKIILIIGAFFLIFVTTVILLLLKGGIANSDKKKEPIPYEKIDFSTNDISSLEFALDGHVLTFPLSVSDLESIGYNVKDKYKSETLPGMNGYMYYSLSASAESDFGSEVSFSACNLSETSKRVTDCDIDAIFADDEHFVLCNGVTIYTSYDEVIEIMGEPTEEEEGYESKTLIYDIDGGFSIYIKYWHNNFDEMETLMISQKM